MAEKMKPCCARLQTAIMRERAELARQARLANRAAARGRSTAKALARIAEIRTALQTIEATIEDHDASHAAEDELAELEHGDCNGSGCTQSHFELRG